KENKEDVILIDASNLGTTIKEDGKNQKTLLSETEEDQIIETFTNKTEVEDFSVVVKYDDIKAKNYSLSAGQYFEVKIEYIDITPEEFDIKLKSFEANLDKLFAESSRLEGKIKNAITNLNYE